MQIYSHEIKVRCGLNKEITLQDIKNCIYSSLDSKKNPVTENNNRDIIISQNNQGKEDENINIQGKKYRILDLIVFEETYEALTIFRSAINRCSKLSKLLDIQLENVVNGKLMSSDLQQSIQTLILGNDKIIESTAKIIKGSSLIIENEREVSEAKSRKTIKNFRFV